jgi:hypothetical protein
VSSCSGAAVALGELDEPVCPATCASVKLVVIPNAMILNTQVAPLHIFMFPHAVKGSLLLFESDFWGPTAGAQCN